MNSFTLITSADSTPNKVIFAGSEAPQSVWDAMTKYHRLCDLNDKHLFLIVLELASLRSGFQHGWVLHKSPFPCLLMAVFLLYLHMEDSELIFLHSLIWSPIAS